MAHIFAEDDIFEADRSDTVALIDAPVALGSEEDGMGRGGERTIGSITITTKTPVYQSSVRW